LIACLPKTNSKNSLIKILPVFKIGNGLFAVSRDARDEKLYIAKG
jgi:hypothetical protein